MSFRIAWELLTVVPVPLKRRPYRGKLGWSMAWFPLIGLIIGLILVGSRGILREFLPPGVEGALVLVVWVALSGGLHLDGFGDCCDGLLGSKPPARRLEIMRDSSLGTFGVVGLACLLILKYGALAHLSPEWSCRALLLSPIASRWAMVWASLRYPYARAEGMGASFREGLGIPEMLFATFTALLFLFLTGRGVGLLSLVVAYAVTVTIAAFSKSRIGGLTGDVYGAVNEVVEVAVLLVVVSGGYIGLF